MPIRHLCLALLAACFIAAPAASAGTPGKWTQLGQQNLRNIDQVALARTPDGTLHAVWTIPAANNDTLVHDAIGPNGVVAPPNVIQTGWAGITPVPDVLAVGGGLRALFGGIRTINSGETNDNLSTATAPASGASWDLQTGNVVKGDSAYGSDIGAAAFADGTPIISWGGTGSGVFVHRGLDQATPNFPLQGQLGGCCGYSPDVAVDASTGVPVVAWVSNADANSGVFAQTLDAGSGAPEGGPLKMPGSTTLFNGVEEMNQQLQRIGIAARAGGGIYIAYPSGYPTTKKVIVWRVPDAKPIPIAESNFDHITSVAADPAGHVWVVWAERGGSAQVFARRSNKAGTKFGPAVKAGHPPAMTSIYKIDANAQSGALDVIGLWGATADNAQWHTQIFAGLDLAAAPSKVKKGKTTSVTFTVSDPDPVKGAKVTVGGKSATTNASGKATIDVSTKKKSVTATATKAGYAKGTLKLKAS